MKNLPKTAETAETAEFTDAEKSRIEFLKRKCQSDFENNSDTWKSWQTALEKEFEIEFIPESKNDSKKN